MSSSHLKNIAIVGGSGNIGAPILDNLLKSKKFNITAISRAESSANFPSEVTVKKGDYGDQDFLISTLKGQDMLIITSSFTAGPGLHTSLIHAAAKAGVPWIIPCEFGSDNGNKEMAAAVPLNGSKAQFRELIEQLGTSSWIGIVNNPWLEYSLGNGMFGIHIKERKATIYDGGNTKFNTTTMPTVALAVTRVCELPIHSSSGQPSLSDYKNNFVYVSSFLTSQNEILAAVQKATGTTPSDWDIEHSTTDKLIAQGHERLGKGDFFGMVDLLYAENMKEGHGGNYEDTKGTANKALGLPKDDMVEAAKRALDQGSH